MPHSGLSRRRPQPRPRSSGSPTLPLPYLRSELGTYPPYLSHSAVLESDVMQTDKTEVCDCSGSDADWEDEEGDQDAALLELLAQAFPLPQRHCRFIQVKGVFLSSSPTLTPSSLLQALKILHEKQLCLSCSECGFTVLAAGRNNSAVQNHVLFHCSRALFVCLVCRRGVRSRGSHQRRFHPHAVWRFKDLRPRHDDELLAILVRCFPAFPLPSSESAPPSPSSGHPQTQGAAALQSRILSCSVGVRDGGDGGGQAEA